MIVKINSEEWYPVYYIEDDPYSYDSYDMSEEDVNKLKELMSIRNEADSNIYKIMDKYDRLN